MIRQNGQERTVWHTFRERDSQHLVAARRSREVVSVRLDLHDGSCLQTTVTVINTSKMNTANDLPRLVFQPTECNFDTTYIAYVPVNHYLERDCQG